MALHRVPFAGLLLVAAGCVTVQKVKPAEFIPQHNPPMVWVTATDNSYTPVAQPRIDGDSLKGTWAGLQEPVAISLNEIQSVQAKLPSPKRTVMLVGIVAASVTGVVYTIATAGNSGDPNFLGCGRIKGTPIPDCPQD
jgi:hypothetical protein